MAWISPWRSSLYRYGDLRVAAPTSTGFPPQRRRSLVPQGCGISPALGSPQVLHAVHRRQFSLAKNPTRVQVHSTSSNMWEGHQDGFAPATLLQNQLHKPVLHQRIQSAIEFVRISTAGSCAKARTMPTLLLHALGHLFQLALGIQIQTAPSAPGEEAADLQTAINPPESE